MHSTPLLERRLDASFESLLFGLLKEWGLVGSEEVLESERFLSRSLAPHVKRLSHMFNRMESDAEVQRHYWKDASNRNHLLAAYFLYFMPGNLMRMASVFSELARLGYRMPGTPLLRAVDFGSGPGTAACGFALSEALTPLGFSEEPGNWALIEKDRKILELAELWVPEFERWLGGSAGLHSTRPFHRNLDLNRPLLPKNAPRFNLWTMSFVINEWKESPEHIADQLLDSWKKHLDDEALVVLVEPALKTEARKLQSIREHLLKKLPELGLQTLLPCLGDRPCGALARGEDWCHEIVSWWRPPSLQRMDALVGLDRKTLPLSYWVLARSNRPLSELLPEASAVEPHPEKLGRVVSPVRTVGRDLECYLCTPDGKKRCRIRQDRPNKKGPTLERGSLVELSSLRGEDHASRLEAKGLKLWPHGD